MTPKGKALQLFDKYDNILHKEYNNLEAIKCALISVDEIIKACEYNLVESNNTDWWNKVKAEIKNL